MSRPLFTVVVPTYNRPRELRAMIESVLSQDFADWDIVVGENHSPAREQVKELVVELNELCGGRIDLLLHEENLGFDRNLRALIARARGRFLFVMGDDDYVAEGAFRAAADALARYPNAGLLLRAFAWFVDRPANVVQITRYYPEETFFEAGHDAIVACFRRLVVMSGLVIDRDLAHACATDRWDGSLFYQHWIAGNVLAQKDAVYIPQLLAYFRRGSPSMWGMARTERDMYTPWVQPPDMHVRMVRWQFEIGEAIEQAWGLSFMNDVRRDYANYAFVMFAGQAHVDRREFYRYYRALGALGLRRYVAFHAWFVAVTLFGAKRLDGLLQWLRRTVGHTPNLSRAARPRVASAQSA